MNATWLSKAPAAAPAEEAGASGRRCDREERLNFRVAPSVAMRALSSPHVQSTFRQRANPAARQRAPSPPPLLDGPLPVLNFFGSSLSRNDSAADLVTLSRSRSHSHSHGSSPYSSPTYGAAFAPRVPSWHRLDEEDADEVWNVSSKLSLPYDPKGKFYRLRASAGGDPKEVFGRFGWYGYYKFGGYIASLYGPPDEARAQIDELMANDFVDKYTRAVQVSTVVGNPNKNLWALATVLFEFPEEGELRITSEACVGAKPLAHVGLAKLLQISDLPLVVLITLSLYLFLNEMGRLRTKGVRNWLLKPQTYVT